MLFQFHPAESDPDHHLQDLDQQSSSSSHRQGRKLGEVKVPEKSDPGPAPGPESGFVRATVREIRPWDYLEAPAGHPSQETILTPAKSERYISQFEKWHQK